MAYHDDQPGHTPIIEGREYYRWSFATYSRYKLIRYNQTTGICILRGSGHVIYESATSLSHWHILPEG